MPNERRPPGYMNEDLQMREVSGPPKYTSRTDKPVEHITIADPHGQVIGYLYANDEDDAAGWVPRPAAGPAAGNLVTPYIRGLLDAKKRGLAPTAALDELLGHAHSGVKAIAGSRATAANLDTLRALAAA